MTIPGAFALIGFVLVGGEALAADCGPRLDAAYGDEIVAHVAYTSVPPLFATAPPIPRIYGLAPSVLLANPRLLKPAPDAIDRVILAAQAPAARAFDARLRAGQTPARLIVATHVSGELQDGAACFLRDDPRARGVPRLTLVESAAQYALKSPALVEQSTLLTYSLAGEFRHPVAAHDVTVMGGNASACLRRSVADLAGAARAAGLARVNLRLISDLIYDFNEAPTVPLDLLRTDGRVDAGILAGELDETLLPLSGGFIPIPATFRVPPGPERVVRMSYWYPRVGGLRIDVTLEAARP